MANAITLYIFEEEGPVFRAQCDYPVVHAVGATEDEAITRASAFIREMLREANAAILQDPPTTLIVRIQRGNQSSVKMQPLFAQREGTPPEKLG